MVGLRLIVVGAKEAENVIFESVAENYAFSLLFHDRFQSEPS